MASLKRHSRIAVFASILLVAFVAQLPGAFAQDAVATGSTEVAPTPADIGASAGTIDPTAEGTNSPDVLTGGAARASGYLCFGRRASVVGTSHSDRLYGTKEQDVIVGLGGDDLISSGEKNDFICAGDGEDQAHSLAGYDHVDGGPGADQLFGGDGNDYLYGQGGNDQINGEGGTDFIYGSDGQDRLNGGESGGGASMPTRVLNTDSDDFIKGGPGGDTMTGGDMHDNMWGQGGNDTLEGNDGSDRMVGGPGRDTFLGGAGDDTANGGPAQDLFHGNEDGDTLWGDGGADVIYGDQGPDAVYGGNGDDVINGGDDNDTLHADGGEDIACGGGGEDTLYGGDQSDFLSGEGGTCSYALSSLLSVFATDVADPWNLIDGGAGLDTCVSPSFLLSPQTVRCDYAGFTKLTINITNGAGQVTSDIVGILNEFAISCNRSAGGTVSGVCVAYFLGYETVTLTATPAGSSVFASWSGDIGGGGSCPQNNAVCTLTMNQNRTVTADFQAPVSLTVNHAAGPGTITSSPAGISLGAGPASQSANFAASSVVTLTAAGFTTSSWTVGSPATVSSGCTANSTTCAVSLTGSATVTVTTT